MFSAKKCSEKLDQLFLLSICCLMDRFNSSVENTAEHCGTNETLSLSVWKLWAHLLYLQVTAPIKESWCTLKGKQLIWGLSYWQSNVALNRRFEPEKSKAQEQNFLQHLCQSILCLFRTFSCPWKDQLAAYPVAVPERLLFKHQNSQAKAKTLTFSGLSPSVKYDSSFAQ